MIIFLFFLTWVTTFISLTFLTSLSHLYAFLWFFVGFLSGYVMVLLTVIITLPFVLIAKPTNRFKHVYLRSMSDFVRLFVLKVCIEEIKGIENIPTDSAFGVYGNHRSGIDALIGLSTFRSRLGMVAKKNIFVNIILNKWFNGFGIFAIDRENAREALKEINKATELMKQGVSMLVFPEGTRKKGEFHNLDTFRPGAFKITTKAKLPIVPIAITGAEKYQKRYLRRTTNVKVIIDKPIYYEDYKDLKPQELSDKVAGKIMIMLKDNEIL